jgi:hypothetical protein
MFEVRAVFETQLPGDLGQHFAGRHGRQRFPSRRLEPLSVLDEADLKFVALLVVVDRPNSPASVNSRGKGH